MARLKAPLGRKLKEKLSLSSSTASPKDECNPTVTATATASVSQPDAQNAGEDKANAYLQASSLNMGASLGVPVNVEASTGLSGHQNPGISIGGNASVGIDGELGIMGGEIRAFAQNVRSTFTSSSAGGLSRSEMTPGLLSPNLRDPLRDRVTPSATLTQETELEERVWSDWGKMIRLPADSNGIVKEVEYRAATVRLCTLNPSFEAKILAEHQHSEDSSMLQDCYLHDRDVHFLSGYFVTERLQMSRNSIYKDELMGIYGGTIGLPLSDPWKKEVHEFNWNEERVFAVVLQKVKFGFGGGIASLGGRFTQFLPQFDGGLDGEVEAKNERVEIVLEDW